MSGLFGSLSMAARALDAQRYGLDVAGQNIANVNTPGYARRRSRCRRCRRTSSLSPGNGVGDHRPARDPRPCGSNAGSSRKRPPSSASWRSPRALARRRDHVGKPGESIDATLSTFFDSARTLAADPDIGRSHARKCCSQGATLASAFRTWRAGSTQARRDTDASVRDGVDPGERADAADRQAERLVRRRRRRRRRRPRH